MSGLNKFLYSLRIVFYGIVYGIVPESNKESVRATVTNILKYSKPPTNCNLSLQQKLALKSLRRDNSIIIIPADKGKAVVVMDSDEYTNKINELLSDKETYLKITDRRRNPVPKVEKDLTKLLSNIKKTPSEHDPDKTQMDRRLYLHLHSTDGTPARLYGLPKVQKPALPLRPITSCINFPTYNLLKHLVKISPPPLVKENTQLKTVLSFPNKLDTDALQMMKSWYHSTLCLCSRPSLPI